MIGISPNIVTVDASHPVVLALKIRPNAIGIRTAVSNMVIKTPITFSSIAILIQTTLSVSSKYLLGIKNLSNTE